MVTYILSLLLFQNRYGCINSSEVVSIRWIPNYNPTRSRSDSNGNTNNNVEQNEQNMIRRFIVAHADANM